MNFVDVHASVQV